jgi:hypothetical protein
MSLCLIADVRGDGVMPWDENYAIAREVRELRKQHKLTQKQLAAVSGINQGEISRIDLALRSQTATSNER